MDTNLFATKTSHYILGATGIVAALSWNRAIKEIINRIFPVPKKEVIANVIYAIIITVLLIVLIIFLPDTSSELPHPLPPIGSVSEQGYRARLTQRLDRLFP